jgi:hypothetical protein
MVSLIFFVFNIAAFCNYYFFCGEALCLGLSSAAYDSGETLLTFAKLQSADLIGSQERIAANQSESTAVLRNGRESIWT